MGIGKGYAFGLLVTLIATMVIIQRWDLLIAGGIGLVLGILAFVLGLRVRMIQQYVVFIVLGLGIVTILVAYYGLSSTLVLWTGSALLSFCFGLELIDSKGEQV